MNLQYLKNTYQFSRLYLNPAMTYGPPRIYPIFGPTGPKMGKLAPKIFFLVFFFVMITLAATSFLKGKLFE